ncbi:SDR family oxidoreductase [Flavihumibacter sp. CACIAM 22H1]|uniref:SDR family NAD(P)-dependent oxidoreductase n=1 Tax=Flavihumibacter sp. CACIAM 22H1 TaxID=1812911 RepID=UPI0007A81D33|nr:SDR family oxidoreductase [Flavihumibacter sp. CACIAM 22H1]KYP15574.1 MAG: short-chain dehydrogenase [Flavihumibacter sp. CACIAM 22H1]
MSTKIALVTGGSRGIGKDIALAMAKKGIDLIITYHSNKQAAEEVVNEINQLGQTAVAFQLDTGNTGSFSAFLGQVTDYLQKSRGSEQFDFLVNNAGTGLYAPIAEVAEIQFDEIFTIHFKGVFFLTQQCLPYIKEQGAILNISSGLTRITMVGSSVYASAKAAVETLTRYLAKELGPRKIRVNVLAPGAIETDFAGGRTRDNKEINSYIAGITALGRVGLPGDIGGVAAFLCTDEAGWINGQRIEVSGGQAI